MTRIASLSTSIFAGAVLALAQGGPAARAAEKPFLHPLFGDGMVLQRDAPVPVWGWAEPGQKVTVEFRDRRVEATADAKGKWMARLAPSAAGGPFTLEVSGPKSVAIKDVLVGDVWICSGQSNMEMPVAASKDSEAEVASADMPQVRLFTVPKAIATEPRETVDGRWEVCSPRTVGGFSAVGYFFGRELNKELKVPIGLIHTSWGGTVAEAWTSAEALETMDAFRSAVAGLRRQAGDGKGAKESYREQLARWWERNDPGTSERPTWADPAYDATTWKSMDLPRHWEEGGLEAFDGVVWFRREFQLPADAAGKDLVLHLGPIDDMDTTWVNGKEVGSNDNWLAPRDYKIPAGVLRPGRNVVAVRVLDTSGPGGLYGKPDELKITAGQGGEPIPLAGPWKYRQGKALGQMQSPPQQVGNNPNVVTVLYNAMIAPLTPFAIKGAIWYQGESNAGRAAEYRTLLPTMIADWRSRFGVGDFPFYIVQLANFMQAQPEPVGSAWAELREAQAMAARSVPHSAVAVAIDIGDAQDIHPKNKQEVGRRLALDALALTYGKPVEYSGPTVRSADFQGHTARLRFEHAEGGLVARGGDKLRGFAVAGADGKFAWADAVVEGDSVVLSSPRVEAPAAVRYGWADNPDCNLYNKAGLPAPPFRTDAPGR